MFISEDNGSHKQLRLNLAQTTPVGRRKTQAARKPLHKLVAVSSLDEEVGTSALGPFF